MNVEFILLGGPWRAHSASLNLACSSAPRKHKRSPVSSLGIVYRDQKMEERNAFTLLPVQILLELLGNPNSPGDHG